MLNAGKRQEKKFVYFTRTGPTSVVMTKYRVGERQAHRSSSRANRKSRPPPTSTQRPQTSPRPMPAIAQVPQKGSARLQKRYGVIRDVSKPESRGSPSSNEPDCGC